MSWSAEVCDELLEVLKYIPKQDYEKIPRETLSYLYANCNTKSSFIYNQALSFSEQEISEEAKGILRKFKKEYWNGNI